MAEHHHDDDDEDPVMQGYPADDDGNDGFHQRDEWVLDCGYEGCCMPGYHFRSECHNAEDMEAYYVEQET
jgi:hypothetical protein